MRDVVVVAYEARADAAQLAHGVQDQLQATGVQVRIKFIESTFDLDTLAAINHRFDHSTPGGSENQAARGALTGPPAPPRDRLEYLGDLTECFDFEGGN